MLSPKRTKFRKMQKGNNRGLAMVGSDISFGDFGLQAVEAGRLTARQIEAARMAIQRHVKRAGKLWIRIFPDRPVTNRGHVKFAPEDYLRARKVNLVVAHPHVCSCAKGCDGGEPHVYVRISGDQCLRTRYLVQTPELTRRFCTDANFVTRHVDCAGGALLAR